MKLVFVHERYQQAGGEDGIFEAESALMESYGHEVIRYTDDNDRIAAMRPWNVAATTVWSRSANRDLRRIFREHRPDIVHFHNTFPLISPSAYYAARAEGIPVVQTIHNYRLVCPAATLYRDDQPCTDCVGRAFAAPSVVHGCYRGSRAGSLVVAGMLTTHRFLRTWRRLVHVYIAPSQFARHKLIVGGLPGNRIVVKPNFINPDPGVGEHTGDFVLFTGRLAPEKGIRTLLRAWDRLGASIPLKIAGDGPLREAVSGGSDAVEWLGHRTRDEVVRLMKDARALIVPSEWYEGFPMVIAEAYATGLPVIGSDIGGLGELVRNSKGGITFAPGDADDLAATVREAWSKPDELRALGEAARRDYEERWTLQRSYEMHLDIYRRAARVRGRAA